MSLHCHAVRFCFAVILVVGGGGVGIVVLYLHSNAGTSWKLLNGTDNVHYESTCIENITIIVMIVIITITAIIVEVFSEIPIMLRKR